jgi:hypothetical protein
VPQHIAKWNPARGAWEVPGTESLICGHSALFSRTWPSSGMTRGGLAYELPTWEHLTGGSAFSSLLGTPRAADGMAHPMRSGVGDAKGRLEDQISMLLPTPEAYQGARGGSQHPEKRAAGGHAVSLQDVTEHLLLPTPTTKDREMDAPGRTGGPSLSAVLLPTPRASDGTKGGPNQRGSSGDLMLPSAVQAFLPTPRAQHGEPRNQNVWARPLDQPQNLENALARLGEPTVPPSDDGSLFSDD